MLFWSIFLGYIVVMMACWCAAAFGLGANQRDRWNRATDKAKFRYSPVPTWADHEPSMDSIQSKYLDITAGNAAIGILLGLIWPIGVPIYLAYRKGQFISQKLAARDKEAK